MEISILLIWEKKGLVGGSGNGPWLYGRHQHPAPAGPVQRCSKVSIRRLTSCISEVARAIGLGEREERRKPAEQVRLELTRDEMRPKPAR